MKRWTLRVSIGVVALLLIAGGIAAYLFHQAGQKGTTPLERWIGNQLKTIAGGYLKPQLEFDDLDYQYPATVTVSRLRLTAIDPATDKPLDIIATRRATIELAERPRQGEPIVIEQIILEDPKLRFVAIAADNSDFVGFSDMLVETAPDPQPKPDVEPVKLSEVFQIRLIELRNGAVVYDDRDPDVGRMLLDEINAKLNVTEDQDGWYALKTNIVRDKLFDLGINGRLNIDTLAMDVSPLTLDMTLARAKDRYLPPSIQKQLQRYDLTGQLKAELSGMLYATDLTRTSLELNVALSEARLAFGSFVLPDSKLDLAAAMNDNTLTLQNLLFTTFGGKVEATGQLKLNDAMPAGVDLMISNMELQRFLREGVENTDPRLKNLQGKVSADIAWKAPLTAAAERSDGQGSVRVREARLVNIPLVSQLGNLMRSTFKAVRINKDAADTADVQFRLAGAHVVVEKLDIRSAGYAARGDGTVHFDGTLDLVLNGGPVETVLPALPLFADAVGASGQRRL